MRERSGRKKERWGDFEKDNGVYAHISLREIFRKLQFNESPTKRYSRKDGILDCLYTRNTLQGVNRGDGKASCSLPLSLPRRKCIGSKSYRGGFLHESLRFAAKTKNLSLSLEISRFVWAFQKTRVFFPFFFFSRKNATSERSFLRYSLSQFSTPSNISWFKQELRTFLDRFKN